MPRPAKSGENGRRRIDAVVKSICDIMRRGSMSGALQYVPELSRLLFLRILDENEQAEREKCEAVGQPFSPSLESPFRWRDWAAKDGEHRRTLAEQPGSAVLKFVNDELLPKLQAFRDNPDAAPRQKIIGQIFRDVEKTQFGDQRNMLDALDKIDELRQPETDTTHVFALSQVYEGLLLKMGEKNNDGGQFFTPREVIRATIKVVNPQIGETVFDPCCGTGGFLAQANDHMRESRGESLSADDLDALKHRTFYGREKETLAYPIALANLVLHGIDQPRIWHGNTLSRMETDASLFDSEDHQKSHDVILTNPPFGGKESLGAQTRFDYRTSSTQVLFMQEIIESLKSGGRCGVVVDEGFLFRADGAFVKTKQRLLRQCDLWCVVSLPPGVFTQAGAGVKTNLLFFNKGKETKKIWYYDLSTIKVNKGNPLTLAHFEEFFNLLQGRKDSARSWTVRIDSADDSACDLRAVNPNRRDKTDNRPPGDILAAIQSKGCDIAAALDELRQM